MASGTNEVAGWNEYRISVLQQLNYLTDQCDKNNTKIDEKFEKLNGKYDDKIDELAKAVDEIKTSTKIMQVKAGLFGGATVFVLTWVFQILLQYFSKKM